MDDFSVSQEKEQIVVEQNALFRVDEYGFFIYWKSDGKDGQVLELSQVNDIRRGGVPKVSLLTWYERPANKLDNNYNDIPSSL